MAPSSPVISVYSPTPENSPGPVTTHSAGLKYTRYGNIKAEHFHFTIPVLKKIIYRTIILTFFIVFFEIKPKIEFKGQNTASL